jgi:hypothetical protein
VSSHQDNGYIQELICPEVELCDNGGHRCVLLYGIHSEGMSVRALT